MQAQAGAPKVRIMNDRHTTFDDNQAAGAGTGQAELPADEIGFFGKRGEPSYADLKAMALKLKAFTEAQATIYAGLEGRKAATLHIHSFLHECRGSGLMNDLKDVIGILALRRGLTWSKVPGSRPYRLLVEIIYPELPNSAVYAIANALSIVRQGDPERAARTIKTRGGVDKMHRRPKTLSASGSRPPVIKQPKPKRVS